MGFANVASLPATLLLASVLAATTSHAQDRNLGRQHRADAATKMIQLAVQRAISSLPPTSAQSFTNDFDPDSEAWVRTDILGPISFLSTRTVGKGYWSARVSASYFEIEERFDPVTYEIDFDNFPNAFTQFGIDAAAKVALVSFAASYGITDRVEAFITVPVAVTEAKASEVFISQPESDAPAIAFGGPNFDDLLTRSRPFGDVGAAFNEGTHVGLGRISLGAKILAYRSKHLRLALVPEIFAPSPSADEFAGSDTGAFLPRLVAELPIRKWANLYTDIGYDIDFEEEALRRFVWRVGGALTFQRASFDLGFGGSEYQDEIDWTPPVAPVEDRLDVGQMFVRGNTSLETSFVEFLAGLKVRLGDRFAVSGALVVPITNGGFQPDALGTVAVEVYL